MIIQRHKFDYEKPFIAGQKGVMIAGKRYSLGDPIPAEDIKEMGQRRALMLWNMRKLAHKGEPSRREKVVQASNTPAPVEPPVEPVAPLVEPVVQTVAPTDETPVEPPAEPIVVTSEEKAVEGAIVPPWGE